MISAQSKSETVAVWGRPGEGRQLLRACGLAFVPFTSVPEAVCFASTFGRLTLIASSRLERLGEEQDSWVPPASTLT